MAWQSMNFVWSYLKIPWIGNLNANLSNLKADKIWQWSSNSWQLAWRMQKERIQKIFYFRLVFKLVDCCWSFKFQKHKSLRLNIFKVLIQIFLKIPSSITMKLDLVQIGICNQPSFNRIESRLLKETFFLLFILLLLVKHKLT